MSGVGVESLILFPFDVILFGLCLFHCFSESESLSVNEMLFVYVIPPLFFSFFSLNSGCVLTVVYLPLQVFLSMRKLLFVVIVDVFDLLPPTPSASVILFSFLSFFFSMGLLTVPGNAISCNTNFHH